MFAENMYFLLSGIENIYITIVNFRRDKAKSVKLSEKLS